MDNNRNRHRSRCYLKQLLLSLPLWTLLAGPSSATVINYQVTNQGGNAFRYEFFPGDMTLLRNQELDIRFDPAVFGNLLNGVADADFRLFLLQPNNPPGAFGDYSALALVDNPSLSGPFSVDVTWLGTGMPGELPFIIHQFDSDGQRIVGVITAASTGAPEPAGWFLSGVGFATLGLLRTVRPRR